MVEEWRREGITTDSEVSLIEPIPPESVIDRLELAGSQRPQLNSIRGSLWGGINGGRIILEARTWTILQQARMGAVYIIDFDDCLMSATSWHGREYQLIERSEVLQRRGVNMSAARAQEVYELSKIYVPSVVVKEARYTPRLNLVLLSLYAEALRAGVQQEQPEIDAWEEILEWRKTITTQVQNLGERALKAYAVDLAIQKIFLQNSPADFLHQGFVQDVLAHTTPADIRIVATRGKIEGSLGQVYKVHASGLMRQRSWRGQGVDLVVYSNDVKAEALILMMEVLPGIRDRLIRIYDDNPREVEPYLEAILRLGAKNIEVVQVSHLDAKRKDAEIGIHPFLDYRRGGTRFRHYAPFPELVTEVPAAGSQDIDRGIRI